MTIKERQALDATFNGLKSVLTKREQFAGMAMQALITNMHCPFDSVGDMAVEAANQLLEALEEDNEVKD